MKRVFLILLIIITSAKADMLVRVPLPQKGNLRIFRRFSVVDVSNDSVTLYIKDSELNSLKDMGFDVQIIISDIKKYTQERIKRTTKVDTSLTMHYHSYSEIIAIMDSIAQANSDIVRLDTIGYSVDGRLLLAAKVSDNPNVKEDEAEVRIVGCHHGNEWPSAEIPLYLLAYLTEEYNNDPYITNLVNNREIWILPMLNPDGHEAQTRYNSNGIDLNRNYGYMWTGDGGDNMPYGQPETDAMYRWSQRENFTMGLTYHTYHPAVNYIWNYSPDHIPDSNLVVTYAQMYGDSTAAYGDAYWVTEGYAWYQTYGDLNDYSMGIDGINDVTIELCHEFVPPDTELDTTWKINRGAIIAFIDKAGQGIHGYVIDSLSGDTIKEAVIYGIERDWPVFTDPETGDYFLPTLAGTYSIKVWANGYETKTINNITVQEDSSVKLDIYLVPSNGYYIYKPVAVAIDRESTPVIKPHIPSILGAPDGNFVSLNDTGWVIVDMGENTPVTGAFTVYEGDDGYPDEHFKVYGSNNYKGPWTYIGEGYGTTTLSLSGSGLSSARYLKIQDAGGNPSGGAIAGFDLDAVENIRTNAPFVILTGDSINDTSGIINGSLDPNDAGYIILAYKNVGTEPAYNVRVWLTSLSNDIAVSEDTVLIDTINTGTTVYPEIQFTVSPSTPPATDVILIAYCEYDTTLREDTLRYTVGAPDSTWVMGPDAYGYYAYDRLDTLYTEWESFSFTDIQGVGTGLSMGDETVQEVSLPFTFKYYGSSYNTVYISSNGWMSLIQPSGAHYTNDQIPNANDPHGVIAPLWDDYDPSVAGNVYYYNDTLHHQFIIEWAGVPRYDNNNEILTFEVILRDPAYYPTLTGDGEIIFVYQRLDNTTSATAGIESTDDNTGLEYLYNGSYSDKAAILIPDGFIKFTTDTPEVNFIREVKKQSVPRIYMPSLVFNQKTSMSITLNQPENVQIKIYDITGRVANSHSLLLHKGLNRVELSNKFKRGIYFVEIKGKSWEYRKKIIVL